MIVKIYLGRAWKGDMVPYSKVIFRNLPGTVEEKHNSVFIRVVALPTETSIRRKYVCLRQIAWFLKWAIKIVKYIIM
jgi:hypothetical protein